MLTKKVKINLNYNQKIIVETLSNEHRLLYNYLLEQTKYDLDFRLLNEHYKSFRYLKQLTISSKTAQNTCRVLINNIKSFYALKKKDFSYKFPYRFKSYKYFFSFTYDYNNGNGGFTIDNNLLIFNLLSSSSTSKKLEIELPEYCSDLNIKNIKTITFKKEHDNYYLIFTYSENTKLYNLNQDNYLSIDLGYSTLVNAITKKENIKIPNYYQKQLDKRIELLQSKKDKKNKNSNRYNKLNNTYKKLKKKKTNQLIDFQHKTSKKLTTYCINNNIKKVIIGDLKVKLINNKNNKLNGNSKLTSIGRFKTFLTYKMKNAGINIEFIDERNTSKMNCLTGKLEFNSSLNNRQFNFNGLLIDRDINSCINILTKSGKWLSQDEKIHLLNNNIINI